ncbi:MAG TPA: hypothetical protein PK054_09485 [Anaerohalosphaeraceae bacterium]|nr:hypothetical protein [Anaerohalosphaeraceae bacterium]HOL89355.1 hypothetical protein [Anaerohalosphaeraceae bacterium]HPP56794.1 hypothetical protein [Anaerohalosphaeraceae bacterium]
MKIAFSTDADLLCYEPMIFKGTSFAGQTLARGQNGQVSGTVFLATGENFPAKQVRAGHLIYLSDGVGNLDGIYEIVRVDSASQLTLSVLRADPESEPIPVGTGTSLFYRIGTFDAQSAEAARLLMEALQIAPDRPDAAFRLEDLLSTEPLRILSVRMVLAMVFASLIQNKETEALYRSKQQHYEQAAEQIRRRTLLRFLSEDGTIVEKTLAPLSPKMSRK